eukprot:4039183-Amphidinium_carterae.2
MVVTCTARAAEHCCIGWGARHMLVEFCRIKLRHCVRGSQHCCHLLLHWLEGSCCTSCCDNWIGGSLPTKKPSIGMHTARQGCLARAFWLFVTLLGKWCQYMASQQSHPGPNFLSIVACLALLSRQSQIPMRQKVDSCDVGLDVVVAVAPVS